MIEFIGAPGSGKSSLVTSSVAYLQQQGFQALKIRDTVQPFARRTALGQAAARLLPWFLNARWPGFVFTLYSLWGGYQFNQKHRELLHYVKSSQQARPFDSEARQRKTIQQFHRLAGHYEFLTSYIEPCEVVVFDEGMVHKVVQLNASDIEEPDLPRITQYLDLLPRSDLVVHITAPLEKCEERVIERGIWKHMSHKSPEQVSQFLENAYHTVNLAVNYLQSSNWCVVQIDNSQDDLYPAEQALRSRLEAMVKFI